MTGHVAAVRSGDDLRCFLSRLLGWASVRAVELALRSIDLAVDHRAALVLCGTGDLVPIAWALHRRAVGADRPFVVCDPRRGNTSASVRSPANHTSGLAAFEAASGGTLCMRSRRLPHDFAALVARLQSTDDVLYAVCSKERIDTQQPLVRPVPLAVPPLTDRAPELDRVISEYASDAIAELGVSPSSCTSDDHVWVRKYAANSLAEIEKATLRLTAIRSSPSASAAAARLGMSLVSLSRWIDRRRRLAREGVARDVVGALDAAPAPTAPGR